MADIFETDEFEAETNDEFGYELDWIQSQK
jgi:hypothetical protein